MITSSHSGDTKGKIARIAFSIALAFFLWVFVISDTDPVTTQKYTNIPVTFRGIELLESKSLMIKDPAVSVDVKLSARTMQLAKVKKNSIQAVADVSMLDEIGNYTVEVKISGIQDNITVQDISQRYLFIHIIEKTSKRVPVNIELTGRPKNGFNVYETDLSEQNIEASGSLEDIEKLSHAKVLVDISDRWEDFEQTFTLIAENEQNEEMPKINMHPGSVTVKILFGETRTLPVKVNTVNMPEEGFALDKAVASPAEVTVVAPGDILAGLEYIPSYPVSLKGKHDTFTENLILNPPEGVRILTEESFRGSFEIKETTETSFVFDSVQIRNIPNGLKCELTDFASLSVSVTSDSRKIDKSDIKVYIDLDNLQEGTHKVKIQYILPKDVKIKDASQKTITVKLQS